MKQMLKRDTALATAAIYDSMFASEDGTVPATFQVIKIEVQGNNSWSKLKLNMFMFVSFMHILLHNMVI
jgi:hypothetical protein